MELLLKSNKLPSERSSGEVGKFGMSREFPEALGKSDSGSQRHAKDCLQNGAPERQFWEERTERGCRRVATAGSSHGARADSRHPHTAHRALTEAHVRSTQGPQQGAGGGGARWGGSAACP